MAPISKITLTTLAVLSAVPLNGDTTNDSRSDRKFITSNNFQRRSKYDRPLEPYDTVEPSMTDYTCGWRTFWGEGRLGIGPGDYFSSDLTPGEASKAIKHYCKNGVKVKGNDQNWTERSFAKLRQYQRFPHGRRVHAYIASNMRDSGVDYYVDAETCESQFRRLIDACGAQRHGVGMMRQWLPEEEGQWIGYGLHAKADGLPWHSHQEYSKYIKPGMSREPGLAVQWMGLGWHL